MEEFLQVAFGYVGLNWKDHVVIDKKYFRPTEVDNFKGDASRAKKVLGWKPWSAWVFPIFASDPQQWGLEMILFKGFLELIQFSIQ